MVKNKVTYGLNKVHLAFFDKSATTQPKWEAPISVPGVVRWAPEAQGDTSSFYADNNNYFTVSANNGYTGELEMALIPDELMARMLGWQVDDNGALIEVTNGVPEKFALIGEISGDQQGRRFVYYNCQADRPSTERTTKSESVEVKTEVFNLTVSPIEIDDITIVKGDMERSTTNATAFDSFFTSVYVPQFGA